MADEKLKFMDMLSIMRVIDDDDRVRKFEDCIEKVFSEVSKKVAEYGRDGSLTIQIKFQCDKKNKNAVNVFAEKLHQEANEQAFKDEKELYNLNIKLQRKTAECEALHTELKFKVEYIQEQREVIKDLEKKLKIAIEALKDIYDKADEIYFDQYRTSLFCKQVRGISIQALEELE